MIKSLRMNGYEIGLLGILLIFNICPVIAAAEIFEFEGDPSQKMTFDVNLIDDHGLTGPADGRAAVDYEFCIPAEERYVEEVRGIDPSVTFLRGSGGRIGCSREEYLCIGNTHQVNAREILYRLAGLPYIQKIARVFWE